MLWFFLERLGLQSHLQSIEHGDHRWKWSAQMLQAGVRPKAPMATTLDWSRTVLEKPKILLSQPTPIEFHALQSLAQMANDMGVGDVEVD